MKRDLYAEVSARIVAELEAGAAPWIKPWAATPGAMQFGQQSPLLRVQRRFAVDGTSSRFSHTALSYIQAGVGVGRARSQKRTRHESVFRQTARGQKTLPDSVTMADQFLRSTGADIREGHREAYYVPSRDFISMPAFGAFNGADHF
jgi:antirestriction protein ArdC